MRSLETNWLSHFDKSLVRPEVVFCHDPQAIEGESCGGFYSHPGRYELLIDGSCYDGRFGIIVVATRFGCTFARATIAHEWRHHWQIHNGIKFDNHEWHLPNSGSWEQVIKKYFRESASEMDALLFEHRIARCESNDEMLDIVMACA